MSKVGRFKEGAMVYKYVEGLGYAGYAFREARLPDWPAGEIAPQTERHLDGRYERAVGRGAGEASLVEWIKVLVGGEFKCFYETKDGLFFEDGDIVYSDS